MKKRVVVTGGGMVSALGNDWNAAQAHLKSLKNCVRYMREWEVYERMNTRLAAPVDWTAPELPRKKIRGMGRVALMAVAAAEDAVHGAGLAGSPVVSAGRCGVAFGSSTGSIDALLDFYNMLITHNLNTMNATTYIKSMPQTCAANIAVFYGLTGRLITTNTACTSGSQAIGFAREAIQNGTQDIMIAGGAEELSPADAAVFDTMFAASVRNDTPALTPAAYDKNRDGLVIGEGAAALVLEDYEYALARGAPVFAELAGFGTNTDGTHLTQPNQATMADAMRLALSDASLDPDCIGYVNMHGTATEAGDIAESNAVREVFRRPVPVSTIKNYTGHTLGACGALEAWLSIMMMRDAWFAPNINLRELDERCGELDYITGGGRAISTEYVMSNNFAFGGINTSLIFKRM